MQFVPSDRRSFLKVVGAVTAASATGHSTLRAAPTDVELPIDAKAALARLLAGNQRFVRGESQRIPVTAQELGELEKGQHPFATILGCSDSRVPVELVFDQGLGDLFVIRLAGNVIDTDIEGSIEYAVAHLQTKLLVVLGHEHCGAVTAAMAAREQPDDDEPRGIRRLLAQVEPVFQGIDPALPKEERLKLAIEANVRQSVREILAFPHYQEASEKHAFAIVGAVYELHTGNVRLLDVPR